MEWISVKDRLPENNDYVVAIDATSEGWTPFIASYERNNYNAEDFGWHYEGDGRYSYPRVVVTHWLPLPEYPQQRCYLRCYRAFSDE